jgi:Family of unknown function (DUF5329)
MRYLPYLFWLLTTVGLAAAEPVNEIESLLHYVGAMDGASFIRNGEVHTPKEAEDHLRLKWTKQKSQIVTAEDFIRLCGTKSSMSGKPYIIRFKDGHEEEAASVLSKQLQVIRGAATSRTQRMRKRELGLTSMNVTPLACARRATHARGSRFKFGT